MSKDFNAEEESVVLRMVQAVALPVLGNVCHVFMNGLNCVQVRICTAFDFLLYLSTQLFNSSVGMLMRAILDLGYCVVFVAGLWFGKIA